MKLNQLYETQHFTAAHDSGIRVWDTEANANTVIPFSDKHALLKFMLTVMKNYNDKVDLSMIREWIGKSRKAGFDYPEFKAIEKSIGKTGEIKEANTSIS